MMSRQEAGHKIPNRPVARSSKSAELCRKITSTRCLGVRHCLLGSLTSNGEAAPLAEAEHVVSMFAIRRWINFADIPAARESQKVGGASPNLTGQWKRERPVVHTCGSQELAMLAFQEEMLTKHSFALKREPGVQH